MSCKVAREQDIAERRSAAGAVRTAQVHGSTALRTVATEHEVAQPRTAASVNAARKAQQAASTDAVATVPAGDGEAIEHRRGPDEREASVHGHHVEAVAALDFQMTRVHSAGAVSFPSMSPDRTVRLRTGLRWMRSDSVPAKPPYTATPGWMANVADCIPAAPGV